MKNKNNTTPLNPGCDDEEATCELLKIPEDLYEQKISFTSETAKKKNATALNKYETDVIRNALLKSWSTKTPDVPMTDIVLNDDDLSIQKHRLHLPRKTVVEIPVVPVVASQLLANAALKASKAKWTIRSRCWKVLPNIDLILQLKRNGREIRFDCTCTMKC
jgi:hypothetical protein